MSEGFKIGDFVRTKTDFTKVQVVEGIVSRIDDDHTVWVIGDSKYGPNREVNDAPENWELVTPRGPTITTGITLEYYNAITGQD